MQAIIVRSLEDKSLGRVGNGRTVRAPHPPGSIHSDFQGKMIRPMLKVALQFQPPLWTHGTFSGSGRRTAAEGRA